MYPDFDERLTALEVRLGVTLKDRRRLIEALTHRSYRNEQRREPPVDNELCGFIGNAVIQLVVATFLARKFRGKVPVAQLAQWRSQLVRAELLGKAGEALGLQEVLLCSRGQARMSPGSSELRNVMAETFQALLGGLSLDQGLGPCLRVIEMFLMAPYLEEVIAAGQDPKSKLQALTQERWGITPHYEIVNSRGPDNDRQFTMAVIVGTARIAQGEGRSKREAEQGAARVALADVNAWAGRVIGSTA